MKIRVSFTVDVDPVAWSREYGTTREDVRADVNLYVHNATHAQFDSQGVLAKREG